jgi:hypothetical protein
MRYMMPRNEMWTSRAARSGRTLSPATNFHGSSRDMLAALMIAVQFQPVGFGPARPWFPVAAREQQRFDGRLVELFGQ